MSNEGFHYAPDDLGLPGGNGQTNDQPTPQSSEKNSEHHELSEEEKKKIVRYIERIEADYQELIDSLPSDKYGYQTYQGNDYPCHSLLFNGNPKINLSDNRLSIVDKYGHTQSLPMSGGESFYGHFYNSLIGDNRSPMFIGEILPENIINHVNELFEKTGQIAVELIEGNEEIKKLYSKYRIATNLEHDTNYHDDEYFKDMDSDELDELYYEFSPEYSENRYRTIKDLQRNLETKISVAESELIKSDPSIMNEYRQIIDEIKQLIAE